MADLPAPNQKLDHAFRIKLREVMADSVSLEELRVVTELIGARFGDLGSSTVSGKVLDLIIWTDNRRKGRELVDALLKERPDLAGPLGLQTPQESVQPQPESAPIRLRDVYTAYEEGAEALVAWLAAKNHQQLAATLALQGRLTENVSKARSFGDGADRSSSRAEIVAGLNAIALATLGVTLERVPEAVAAPAAGESGTTPPRRDGGEPEEGNGAARQVRSLVPFTVTITRSGEHYRTHVACALCGSGSTTFALPFTQAEMETKLAALRDRAMTPAEGQALGQALWDAAFRGEPAQRWFAARAAAENAGQTLLMRFDLTSVPELGRWPWEIIHIDSAFTYPALSRRTPVARTLDAPFAEKSPFQGPLRVFGVAAQPLTAQLLDVPGERQAVEKALAEVGGVATAEWAPNGEFAPLHRLLRRRTPAIFHFIGHGTFDEQAQGGKLLFETPEGMEDPVSAERVTQLLKEDGIRLVLLNACRGAEGGVANPFAGVAGALVRSGLEAVVAMQFPVSDDAAVAFASEFYTVLAEGFSLPEAVAEGRRAIYFTKGDSLEWVTPVLFIG